MPCGSCLAPRITIDLSHRKHTKKLTVVAFCTGNFHKILGWSSSKPQLSWMPFPWVVFLYLLIYGPQSMWENQSLEWYSFSIRNICKHWCLVLRSKCFMFQSIKFFVMSFPVWEASCVLMGNQVSVMHHFWHLMKESVKRYTLFAIWNIR